MAAWSKALPLIANCPSPLPGFETRSQVGEKVASDLGSGVGFLGYSVYLHQLQPRYFKKVTKIQIPNSKVPDSK